MNQLSFADEFKQQQLFVGGHTGAFDRLSDELILQIFSYLSKASLSSCGTTCRRLHYLSLDESLWKRLDLGNKAVSGQLLHKFIDRGVQYLRLAKANICGLFYPNLPPPTPSRLRFLDLSMVDNDDPVLINEILSRCRELRAVSLENCCVNLSSCMSLAKNTDLRVLNLSAAHGLTNVGMKFISTGCRLLEHLNIAWTNLDAETVSLVCANLPQSMKRLNLAGCREGVLYDSNIAALCASCPNLMELDISDSPDLTALSMGCISSCLLNLRVFSCSRCYKIDPNAYLILPPLLMELNIFNSIHQESWAAFENMMPESIRLNISPFSTVARPTVGVRRTSIWGYRVRDSD